MPLIFKNQHGAQRFRMPWGAVAGAAVSYGLNELGSKDKNGGAGTQTTDKAPWLMAQPWIMNNMTQGQALQQRYTDNPLSVEQRQAVDNIYGQSDYMRNLIPSLLGQVQSQQVGFDPSKPNAKPKAWDWNAAGGAGALGQGSIAAARAAAPAPAPAAAKTPGDFVNLDVTNPSNAYLGQVLSQNGAQGFTPQDQGLLSQLQQSAGGAGYGTFKYGMAMPQPGTQQYRDLQEYIAYGGADPYGLYKPRAYSWNGGNGPGVSVGDGIGVAGSAASVGSSANF